MRRSRGSRRRARVVVSTFFFQLCRQSSTGFLPHVTTGRHSSTAHDTIETNLRLATTTDEDVTYRAASRPGARRTVAFMPNMAHRRISWLPIRPAQSSVVNRTGGMRGETSSNAGVEDPFRRERPSISPAIINALVRVLFHGDDADMAATISSEQRSSSDDWRLTEDEKRDVTARVCGVADNLMELRFMLAAAVSRHPYIEKHGMLSDYGMDEDVEDNPLAQMNQAECLLALYMLHKEQGGTSHAAAVGSGRAAVDFLDEDRLDVLTGHTSM